MSRSHLERGPRLELQHKPPEKQTNETTQPNKTTKPKKGMMMLTLVLNVDYVSKRQVRSFHPATLARGAEWKSLDWRANWWMELFCGNETWKGNCKFVYHALLCRILYNILGVFKVLLWGLLKHSGVSWCGWCQGQEGMKCYVGLWKGDYLICKTQMVAKNFLAA